MAFDSAEHQPGISEVFECVAEYPAIAICIFLPKFMVAMLNVQGQAFIGVVSGNFGIFRIDVYAPVMTGWIQLFIRPCECSRTAANLNQPRGALGNHSKQVGIVAIMGRCLFHSLSPFFDIVLIGFIPGGSAEISFAFVDQSQIPGATRNILLFCLATEIEVVEVKFECLVKEQCIREECLALSRQQQSIQQFHLLPGCSK